MNTNALKRSLRLGLIVFVGMVIFAYGFQVTQVSLDKTREPRRQESFIRILRALVRPDILEYEQDEFIVEAPIYMPCNAQMDIPEPPTDQPYMVIDPPCNEPEGEVTIEGFNFAPNTEGPLNFIPPSGVSLQVGKALPDGEGHFIVTVQLPNRQPVEEAQHIRAITRRNTGRPHLSENGLATWEKIIETVFLALLATALGTVLAIPISFLAARNIMRDIKSPLASVALSILGWPAGIAIGLVVGRWLSGISQAITENSLYYIIALIACPLIVWLLVRWALPHEDEEPPTLSLKLTRLLALIVTTLVAILALFLVAVLAMRAGDAIAGPLGAFGFMGTFFANLGDIVNTILVLVIALATGALFGSWTGRLGQFLTESLPTGLLTALNLLLGAVAGAAFLALLGGAVEWLYGVGDPVKTLWIPAMVGALLGILIVLRAPNKESVPIGMVIYYILRTILNALRSIEAFIMAIIFVVLVSTGPFAGVLALSLHTVAALAKLYSEQVESILPGPLEAIRATGATRLQTIVYAVIPQIVPPYISFTMYRWDINVRMSTIIGFAGGGGIGLLLQQNINLLNYRAASAQMLAITIVVALMDYISSEMRERVV